MADEARLPLGGIRVIDASQVIAGPFLAQLLGDFGADVIKVEHPRGDPGRLFGPSRDGVSLNWKVLARNKRGITLDLGQPEGAELLLRLAADADVLLLSFRPPTLERYGLTYEALAAVNPRLIAVYVTGFGLEGPYRDRPAFGTLVEAMSGYADLTGQPDGPPTLPQFALADHVAAVHGAYGVMVALWERDVGGSGCGQFIDLTLIEPLFGILGPLTTLYDQLGRIPTRMGSRIYANAPRNVYQTADDRWIAVAASVQQIARRFFEAIGSPELFEDPRFATAAARVANVDEVDRIASEWFAQHTREEALAIMIEHEVAVAPVLNVAELLKDPQIKALGTIETVPDADLGPVRMQGVQPRLSRTPGRIERTGPALGAHNREVYCELLGLSDDQLVDLRGRGII